MNFKTWLKQIGKSESTAQKYSGAVSNSISKWANNAGLTQNKLTKIDSLKEFTQLSSEIQKLSIFIKRNTKGNKMYSNALNHYAAYLKDVYQENIKEDIEILLDDSVVSKTEKLQLISARLGQGKFRNHQIEQWQRCALTGYLDTRFLIASHIKPWREANNFERLDCYNGLLLLPNLDKVFDLGFITFKQQGEIVISKHLENYQALGISSDMKLDLQIGHQDFMTYHRDVEFEKRIHA